ncbi:glutamate ligase domain-containing protein [Kitasatospora sp. NPDC059973]|uniref:glutamate ligase domain-containing protein n=1 Tax=Kitasatospora sp. NPDC059973 TaxID=3347020 RepID=UPI0036AF4638
MTTMSPPPSGFHRGHLPGLLERPHLDTVEPGLSGLAQYLTQAGSRLTAPSGTIEALGLPRSAVRTTEQPAVDRTCVIGPPAARDQLRAASATSLDLPALTSSEAVALLVDATARSIVVAGTYGTALPAALTVSALAHLNPAWVVEQPPAGRAAGHSSGGDLLVAVLPSPSADAAQCAPTVLLVTGVARTGADSAEMNQALTGLMPLALRSKAVVVEHADLGARLLAERLTAAGHRRVVTVGSNSSCGVRVVQALWIGVSRVAVSTGGEVHQFTLATPGRHSALAAAAAFAASLEIGAQPQDVASGFTAFPGVPGFLTSSTMHEMPQAITVLTSLARCPEEIADDLDAAHELTDGKVVLLGDLSAYRPDQAEALARALAEASHVVLLAAPDDRHDDARTIAAVLDAGLTRESVTVLRHGPCEPALPAVLADLATAGDIVLLLAPLPAYLEAQ